MPDAKCTKCGCLFFDRDPPREHCHACRAAPAANPPRHAPIPHEHPDHAAENLKVGIRFRDMYPETHETDEEAGMYELGVELKPSYFRDKELSCALCGMFFIREEKCVRMLSCGHFCHEPCIDSVTRTGNKQCRVCGKTFM